MCRKVRYVTGVCTALQNTAPQEYRRFYRLAIKLAFEPEITGSYHYKTHNGRRTII